MTIGVTSDTHWPSRGRSLPPQLLAAFAGVDLILHAGDLNLLAVLEPLRAIAPVQAVSGNTDPDEVTRVWPERLELELAGVSLGLVHGHAGEGRTTPERARSWFPAARVVVFGHSHQPLIAQVDGQWLVNPGSPTDRRRAPRHSCARLTLTAGEVAAELVEW